MNAGSQLGTGKRAEQPEIDYRGLFEALPGLFLILLPDDPAFTIVAASNAYLKASKLSRENIVCHSLIEIFPASPDAVHAATQGNVLASIKRVLATRKPDSMPVQQYNVRREQGEGGGFEERHWSPVNSPVLNPDGTILLLVHRVEDVTDFVLLKRKEAQQQDLAEAERARADQISAELSLSSRELTHVKQLGSEREHTEKRNNLLMRVDDAIRGLTDLHEIPRTVAELTGEHLQVNRCMYAIVRADEESFDLICPYSKDVPVVDGGYLFSDFGKNLGPFLREGQPWVIDDAETDPRTADDRESYRMAQARSGIAIPFLKDGRLVGVMSVSHITPRHWEPDEVELLQMVATRCWESVERASITRELREREHRFRCLAESIPQMIWTATPDGALDYASEQAARYFGIEPEAVHRAGWLQWVHPDDREPTVERWKHSLESATPYETSFRLRRASDGSWRWHLALAQPLLDEGGKVVQWIGTCTEIEDQKQAEVHLQQQWRIFDSALSNTPDHIYTLDREARFTYANRALLSFLQKPLEELVGNLGVDFVSSPELAEGMRQQIEQVIDTKQPLRDRSSLTGVTGEVRSYEYILAPVLTANGQVEAVAGSARDITDRQRIEKAFEESEARLQQVFAQAPVGICVLRGPQLVFELANSSYAEFLPGRVLVGRPMLEVIPEIDPKELGALHRVLDTGEPVIANESPVLLDRNGVAEHRWFNYLLHPLRDADGMVSGIVTVVVDVTLQVRARLELQRVNRELEEFAYVASHDLQEPLRMVNIYTHLILKKLPSENQEIAEYGAFVRTGVLRMEKLIRDLLTFSLTVHTESLPVGIADLSASLTEALSALKIRLEENRAIVTALALPTVRGDTTQLTHVFLNLISNALKYRKKDQIPTIHIAAKQDGEQWIISMQDNGIGFEQQYAERIFGLFKRLHKDEYPGTGLGLAICKRIVERYGGRMWAEGRPGEGSTFNFSLPRVVEK